jgi:hypothetical protein
MVQSNVSGRSSLYGSLFCTFVILLTSFVIQTHKSSSLNDYVSKTISTSKPYETFEEFYPFYMREHVQTSTRQWHYIGTSLVLLYLLTQPMLILAMLTAGLAGYASMPFCRHYTTGLLEMMILMTTYLLGGKLLTHSVKRTLIPLMLGYTFAWIGHFFFENNKPATFTYPTFSLLGDFRMLYDAIRG